MPQVAEDFSRNVVGQISGAALAALFTVLGLVTFHFADVIGWALAGVIWLAEFVYVLWCLGLFLRYVGVLGAGADPPGSRERQAYDALRDALIGGSLPDRYYRAKLKAAIDTVDQFFGDAGKASQTFFPHAFGLTTQAPLWTPSALDRCLLLALLYPVAIIFLMWAVTGHVGPAEAALRLRPALPWLQQGISVVALMVGVVGYWKASSTVGWKFPIWFALAVAGCTTFAGIGTTIGSGPSVVVLITIALGVFRASAQTSALGRTGGGAVAVASAFAFALAFSMPEILGLTISGPGAIFPVAAVIFLGTGPIAIGIALLQSHAASKRLEGRFLWRFLIVLGLLCFCATRFLGSLESWPVTGPLLLFLVLLTVINAPFDWASLGLTRALLRRGLELKGLWPFGFALLDAALAALFVVVLALTMIVGVQAFNGIATQGGGKPILPVGTLLSGILVNPTAPQYFWVYVVLISTMIPSVCNLAIGGLSLFRGLPWLSSLLLRHIRAGEAVPTFDRIGIAGCLTAQFAFGGILGIALQGLLAVLIVGYVMPHLGIGLLDLANALIDFDLPARVGHLFRVSL